jgi:hypothetical protein
LTGTGTGSFLPRGDGDGDAFPDGEFPIAIPACELSFFILIEIVGKRVICIEMEI